MTVYLSSHWLDNSVYLTPATPDGEPNDFGVAHAVAHEVGHAVQAELRIERPERSATVSPTELQADCLAG